MRGSKKVRFNDGIRCAWMVVCVGGCYDGVLLLYYYYYYYCINIALILHYYCIIIALILH
jgi:hypothetical protein